MANIGYQAPIVNVPASIESPTMQGLPASAHCNEADIVVLSSGQISPAAVGASANIAGIVQQDSNATFFDTTSGSLQGVFGFGQQASGGLAPGSPGWVLFVPLGPPIIVAMSLPTTVGWVTGGSTQANVGTAVGLNKDATTGFYYADPAQTAVGHIIGKVWGPFMGVAGDTGARVFVAFDVAGVLAPVQGH